MTAWSPKVKMDAVNIPSHFAMAHDPFPITSARTSRNGR